MRNHTYWSIKCRQVNILFLHLMTFQGMERPGFQCESVPCLLNFLAFWYKKKAASYSHKQGHAESSSGTGAQMFGYITILYFLQEVTLGHQVCIYLIKYLIYFKIHFMQFWSIIIRDVQVITEADAIRISMHNQRYDTLKTYEAASDGIRFTPITMQCDSIRFYSTQCDSMQ